MALLSGTAAQVALDLLRSGRAFEADGVKMFERALKATQRGQVPEGAVSEFRKLVNGLEAEAINRRLQISRYPMGKVDVTEPSTWSKLRMERNYIPRSVDYWTNFASRYDNASADFFRRQADLADTKAAQHSVESVWGFEPKGAAGVKRRLRQSAVDDRTNATIIEALVRLFGEKGPT